MSHIENDTIDNIFHTSAGVLKRFKDKLAGGEYEKQQEARMQKTPEGKKLLTDIKNKGTMNTLKQRIIGK